MPCQSLRYKSEFTASLVRIAGSKPYGVEPKFFSTFMQCSEHLCISTICSSKVDLVKSDTFNKVFYDPGSSTLASERVACRSSDSSGGRTT